MPPIVPAKKQPTEIVFDPNKSEDIVRKAHHKGMSVAYAAYKDVMDIALTTDRKIVSDDMTEIEGSHNFGAVAEILKRLNGKTYEERIETVKDITARLLSGEILFQGQTDPFEYEADTAEDYYDLHATYITELLEYANNFALEDYTQYEQDTQAAYEDRGGLKYKLDIIGDNGKNKEIAPILHAGVGTGISFEDNLLPFKKDIFKRAAMLQDKEPRFATRKAERAMNAWEKGAPDKTGRTANIPEDKVPDLNKVYMLKGEAILNDLASKHFSRERPSFFARIFRTKEAREYAAERTMMESIAKKLDTQQKLRRVEKVDYTKYLNRKTIVDSADRLESALADERSSSTLTEEEKNTVFGNMDAEIEKIDNFYARPEFKNPTGPNVLPNDPPVEVNTAQKETKSDPELAAQLSESITKEEKDLKTDNNLVGPETTFQKSPKTNEIT